MLLGAFDTLAHHATSAQDRRASLKSLGVATLVTTLAMPRSVAGKKNKKNKNKNKNKNKKKCNAEKAGCQAAIDAICVNEPECLALFAACCQTCNAGTEVQCVFKALTT